MSLSSITLKRERFTLVAAIGVVFAGLIALIGFPATEEPTVTFRNATVEAYLPGASTQRMEQRVAQPLEERIRQLAEVKSVATVIRPNLAILNVRLSASVKPSAVPTVWQKLRAKVNDARASLPGDLASLNVNDDYGRVSVMTLALTGPGYSVGQLQDAARSLRMRLQTTPGTEQVALFGVQSEQIYVELSPQKLTAAGITLPQIAQALAARNVVASAGEIDGAQTLSIETTGEITEADGIARVPIAIPGGGTVTLASLGTVSQRALDPPTSAALYIGQPAVVLGISMHKGLNVNEFSKGMQASIDAAKASLPVGMSLHAVTNQSEVVTDDLLKVGQVFLETIVIVMGVVVFFLGWRAGLVTGLIVPITVLGTLLFMRAASIELHTISIAAIIISLGLFVDNAIVIIEDFQRRLGLGEDRAKAAEAAGRTMFVPLLISSLAIIFSFMPLAAGESDTSEYMSSLAIVLTATLLISLFLAVTFTVVTAKMFAGGDHHEESQTNTIAKIRRWYIARIAFILKRPLTILIAMAVLLSSAVFAISRLPTELLPPSARQQLQMTIELPAGTASGETLKLATKVSQRLKDPKAFPELTGNVVYVGDGGPRFILGLNPPFPAPHKAYAVINLAHKAKPQDVMAHIQSVMRTAFPEARMEVKRFSRAGSEAGTAEFRLIGPDRARLEAAAVTLKANLQTLPGVSRDDIKIRDNVERRILGVKVEIDQTRALAAGLTTSTITSALDAAYGGVTATVLQQGEVQVPVIVRAGADVRQNIDALAALPILTPQGPVSLSEVARVEVSSQPSVLNRRNEMPFVSVTVRAQGLTAQSIADAAQPYLDKLNLPEGHMIELGGEIEESGEANQGLIDYFPLALFGMATLFLWQFSSVRKTIIVMASIPFVLIGATLGLYVTGQPLSFPAILGLLALAGIIVNNAVLLLERIKEEREQGRTHLEAVSIAAQVRLRPIVMTKLTCILGLLPLFLFGGDLWKPLAAAMIGGLLLGTLITLVLIPALYALLFNANQAEIPASEIAQ
jgi:multidrug efflux pump subunit AcrB